MRILIVHNHYAQRGGEDAVVESEARALRARGHEVHLLTRDSLALHQAPLQGAAETLLASGNPQAAYVLDRTLRDTQPEVVHLHNLFPRWGLAALTTLEKRRVPVVQTLHNSRWLCVPATFLREGRDCRLCARGNFWSAVRFACMRDQRLISAAYAAALARNRARGLAERVVDRFVCVSSFVREAHLAAGFASHKLVIKGNFVEAALGSEGPGDGSVIFVGRLSEEKGITTLVQASQLLPGVTVKIVGEGPARGQLEAACARSAARIVMLGRLTREVLQREVQRSSVCVVPSAGSETFGLSALEAFACARPVVATDAGGLPELVRDGENGWIVPRGDAAQLAARVRWLLEDPESAQSFGRAGRALVQRAYLPASNMATLEAIYAAAIAAHHAPQV